MKMSVKVIDDIWFQQYEKLIMLMDGIFTDLIVHHLLFGKFPSRLLVDSTVSPTPAGGGGKCWWIHI